MKKFLYVNGEKSGIIGKPVFKDSLGKQLCIGDIVYTIGQSHSSINIVVEDCIYGWGESTYNGELDKISVYKIINYTQIENLDERILKKIGIKIVIKNCNKKEMTIAEIEKELGYQIKIVKK